MYRYCLTIRSLSINLPPGSCKLRFIIRSSLQNPKCIEQVTLKRKETQLFLSQDIVFTVPPDSQQAVSVYIIAVTSQMIVHLGMFILELNDQYEQNDVTKKIKGCIGQNGQVSFQLTSLKQSQNVSSSYVEAKSQSKQSEDYLSSVNQSSVNNYEMQQQLDKLRNYSERKQREYFSLEQKFNELKKENSSVKKQAKQYQNLSNKLAAKYQQVVNQNINLKSRFTQSQTSSVVQVRIITQNKASQTQSYHDIPTPQLLQISKPISQPPPSNNIKQNPPTSSQSQTQTIQQPPLQIMKTIVKNHKINLLQYLSKIQQMQYQQLKCQMQYKIRSLSLNKKQSSYQNGCPLQQQSI